MHKGFKKTKNLIRDILEKDPQARNSDMYLYFRVVERINAPALNKSFGEVITGLQDLGLPCFETVRRTRQKLQSENPKLEACAKVQDYRTAEEILFRKEFGQ